MVISLSLIALCLFFPGEIRAHEGILGPQAAVVVGKQIYWRGEPSVRSAFRLYSVSLDESHAIEEHDYALSHSSAQPVAWHVLDAEVWTLTGRGSSGPTARYVLEKSPLSRNKIHVYHWGEFAVSSCEPLDHLGFKFKLWRQPSPPFYFDYVPTDGEHGRLFVVTEDRKMTQWEFTVGDIKLEGFGDRFPLERTGETWKETDKLDADFFAPFQIYLKNDKPQAITASGKQYAVKTVEDHSKWVEVSKTGADPILLTVDDRQKKAVYLLTKRTMSVLGQPDSERPFEMPAIGKTPEEVGKALSQIVELIHRQ